MRFGRAKIGKKELVNYFFKVLFLENKSVTSWMSMVSFFFLLPDEGGQMAADGLEFSAEFVLFATVPAVGHEKRIVCEPPLPTHQSKACGLMQANAGDAAVDVGDQPELFLVTAFQRCVRRESVIQAVESLTGTQHVLAESVFVLLALNIVRIGCRGFAEPGG